MRVTHAHPLHPAVLAFVSFGIVLVRVRVRAPEWASSDFFFRSADAGALGAVEHGGGETMVR